MNPESLEIILKLKEENVLLERAIEEVSIMLFKKELYAVPKSNIDAIKVLFAATESILKEFDDCKKGSLKTDEPR